MTLLGVRPGALPERRLVELVAAESLTIVQRSQLRLERVLSTSHRVPADDVCATIIGVRDLEFGFPSGVAKSSSEVGLEAVVSCGLLAATRAAPLSFVRVVGEDRLVGRPVTGLGFVEREFAWVHCATTPEAAEVRSCRVNGSPLGIGHLGDVEFRTALSLGYKRHEFTVPRG